MQNCTPKIIDVWKMYLTLLSRVQKNLSVTPDSHISHSEWLGTISRDTKNAQQ